MKELRVRKKSIVVGLFFFGLKGLAIRERERRRVPSLVRQPEGPFDVIDFRLFVQPILILQGVSHIL